jgi:TonB-linked SusC/RagA family outer membrane protein
VLAEDATALEEVVVIGYGTQRREAITGSVASMSGGVLRDVAATNISTALQGRIAGVEMTQTSSKPGAAMEIRIRGTRSLSASNDPLVVLDGIPFAGTLNDIDPNSIKSVDILKDASATAIYGSRGANGVILVTTNRGYTGQKARISYNGYYGMKSAIDYPMMDGPQFAKLREEAVRTVNEIGGGAKYPNSDDESNDINTNWQDMFFRTGIVTSHDIGISKGSDDGSYTFGGGYYKDEAVIPLQQYTRISLRAAIDQGVGKYMRFGLTSNNSYGFSEGNQINVGDVLSSSPLANPYDADGNLKRATFASQDPYKLWTKETLKAAEDVWRSDSRTLGSYNTLYGEIEAPWVKGLKYRINLGLNIRFTTGGGFTGIGATNPTDPNSLSAASISNSLTTNWAVENLLTYDRIFADKHRVNVVGLYSAEENKYNRSAISARDLPADHFQYWDLSKAEGEITIGAGDQAYSLSGLTSWMGRVMYSYDDRYMLSATLRSDGSSRLASGFQWHTYPAVSAGWNLHNETFMTMPEWVNQLKLRVGYGETSNQAIDPYKTLGRLTARPYNFDETYLTGYYISELPNKKLGWEYTSTWNYGLDFSFLNKRLNGTIEYYAQHTKDILLSVRLPSTTGVPTYMANIGETQNKGFELSLNGVILDNFNGWSWDVGVNLYSNRNELLALTSGQERDTGNGWFVGHPINVVYDYKKIGIWQQGDPYLDILEPGGNVGMIKVLYTGDYNADGTPARKIDTDDRQITDLEADFQGGFNTRVGYKGFDLSLVGGFKSGGTLISTLYGGTSYLNNLAGRHGNVNVDYWTPENTSGKYPRPGGILAGDSPKYANTMALFDASYLKVRVITLGYTFNQKCIKSLGMDNLRVYATVQNPFVLFSDYNNESGLDPESNSYGNENQAISGANAQYQTRLPIVGYNTPSTKNYLFGLSITF